MPPKPPLDAAQLKLLRDEADLLHLLFHRNKNQHRLLKWWQWLSTLRRNLTKLLAEHDLITNAKTTPNRNAAVVKFKDRVAFMRTVVVPSAYTAFGSVIESRVFAPLGMVLIGVLARVWKILRPSEEELEKERGAVKVLIEKEMDLDMELGTVISREEYAGGQKEEVGEVILRAEYEKAIGFGEKWKAKDVAPSKVRSVENRGEKASLKPRPADTTKKTKKTDTGSAKSKREATQSSPEPTKTKEKDSGRAQSETTAIERKPKRKLETELGKKKKKKRKKGDDIDDLFSGLF
jgi:ribonuclease MRP protein subunit RMP1